MIRLAINGYGRIGRNVLRALYESGRTDTHRIVAINDLGDAEVNAHLTRHDTAHGAFGIPVEVAGGNLVIGGDEIRVLSERDPRRLPWGDMNVDVVLECTGLFTSAEKAGMHLEAGAGKVLISAPGGEGIDRTVVYGVNHGELLPGDRLVSNASCTTNCLAPMARALQDAIGIEQGLMTTIHAYTNDQILTDSYHKDLRRASAAGYSMIPTSTGAARAVGLVLPSLAGRLDGFAVRVPTINVSIVDLTFTASRTTSVEEVNRVLAAAADGTILRYGESPLVSIDYNHTPSSSNVDGTLTRVLDGTLVKACSWYDNEWGFSNRMLDTAAAMMAA